MNVKRFTARTSRDALALVKAAFGDDAVVMSNKPCAEGVEVLAMAPESVQQLERVGAAAPRHHLARQPQAPARQEPRLDAEVAGDIEALQMSTLSFQDYVRERMLKRRDAEREAERDAEQQAGYEAEQAAAQRAAELPRARPPARAAAVAPQRAAEPPAAAPTVVAPIEAARARLSARREPPVLHDEVRLPEAPGAAALAAMNQAARGDQVEMMSELRSMRGLIEQRFGALAFMEKLQRQPRQAHLAQRLLETGFSPALIRRLVDSLPEAGDPLAWAAGVLERNLPAAEREPALEDVGGVYALVGATGVGKTTSSAKLAAAFATRHGAANLGLVTLDAYRVGAHEQLRTYGRILGVPVHTAHDRASLEDLLELLSAKRMVLIDTAGMAQRDVRTRELLEMLSHRSIHRLLVVNASAQGETIEDQLAAYAAQGCRGVVLSKLDEAVKLGPALDSMIRHRLKVVAVANGQRVPEDWHRLSASALVQRALRGGGSAAWKLDDADVGLIFAAQPAAGRMAAAGVGVGASAGAVSPARR